MSDRFDAEGRHIAMRNTVGGSTQVYYLLADDLGSMDTMPDPSGNK